MSDIKPNPVKSAYVRGGGRGGGKGGGRGGRGERSNQSRSGQIQNQKSRPVPQKFKGKSSDLEGYIFYCSDSRQADKYITAIKIITEYFLDVLLDFSMKLNIDFYLDHILNLILYL